MIKNFFTCGLVGWCLEIVFTACSSLKNKNFKLMGNTSLWMFPIYGMAAFFKPLYYLIKKWPAIFRGVLYTICIFSAEFLTGSALRRLDACPWNYKSAPYNVDGLIRFDYAPFWFGTGLLYEYILKRKGKKPVSAS